MSEWRNDAACKHLGPRFMFPPTDNMVAVKAAISICGTCPVRSACLNHALEHDEIYGVWGGTTPRERTQLFRRRRRLSGHLSISVSSTKVLA